MAFPSTGSVALMGGKGETKSFADAVEGLRGLMFDPKLSIERFRGDFESPREMLGLVQSLLVVALRTSPPPSSSGNAKEKDDVGGSAYSVYWERFMHHMKAKRAAGGSLLDNLFDCLDALGVEHRPF